MKANFFKLIALTTLLTACGTASTESETLAIQGGSYDRHCQRDTTYRDAYDCNSMTKVVGTRVLDTLWNVPPSRQYIADIKNVDVTYEIMQVYIGSGNRLTHQIFVRSWVDFGEKTLNITAIDKDRPQEFRHNKARKVGVDDNGQFIYMLAFPAQRGMSHQVYLEIEYNGRTHYSNEGRLDSSKFFELHTRGI